MFKSSLVFKHDIFVLTVHPSLSITVLNCLDLSKLKAIIVRTFGSGNFPMKGEFNLLPFFEKCREHGVIVAIISQADYDSVDLSKYAAGKAALNAGAISAGDMTLEAALTKLMFLLAQSDSKEYIEHQFQVPMAGELSEKFVSEN